MNTRKLVSQMAVSKLPCKSPICIAKSEAVICHVLYVSMFSFYILPLLVLLGIYFLCNHFNTIKISCPYSNSLRQSIKRILLRSFYIRTFDYLFRLFLQLRLYSGMDTQTLLNVSKSTAKLVGLSIDIVKGLTLLCQRYKDEQLILQSTAAQVTVLSAALSRIEELAKSGNAVQYHQLAIDLGNSLLCCGLLLARLDQDVSELEKDALQGNISARLKTAFNGGPAIEIQAMIDRQANALTLLLTAYSW